MRTPSHFIITATINTTIPEQDRHTSAFFIGSILPDIPFTILTVVYGIYYHFFGTIPSNISTMEYLHFDLFYNDPVWIVSHNVFHSLVIGSLILIIGYVNRSKRWGKFLSWLAIGTLIHTVLDIFTHHIDGPLFLFPLNWTYRFESSISYWQPEYFGNEFRVFEYLLNIALVLYLGVKWYVARQSKN